MSTAEGWIKGDPGPGVTHENRCPGRDRRNENMSVTSDERSGDGVEGVPDGRKGLRHRTAPSSDPRDHERSSRSTPVTL